MSHRSESTSEDLNVDALVALLDEQDEQMQVLFAKAINLFVAPGADQISDSEKVARLREAVEQSFS